MTLHPVHDPSHRPVTGVILEAGYTQCVRCHAVLPTRRGDHGVRRRRAGVLGVWGSPDPPVRLVRGARVLRLLSGAPPRRRGGLPAMLGRGDAGPTLTAMRGCRSHHTEEES